MRVIDRLERRLGWFAIKNLTLILVAGNALVWLIGFVFAENAFVSRLVLIPSDVFKGEVWRVVTFLFVNSYGGSPLFVILELYFLYLVGSNLEAYWGCYRFTVYYFIGYALTVAVSLITGIPAVGAKYIHLSLFFAFAQLVPDMQILLFFILPVKIKWLAWLSWALTAYEFVMAPSWGYRLYIFAPIVAFSLFFGSGIVRSIRNNRKAFANKRTFEHKKSTAKIVRHSFHKCEVCGRTERDAPDMDFRYCSKCEGNYEYCMDHLNDHYHRSQ